jgi:hypothetical protein
MTQVTNAWSPDELAILREHYPRLGPKRTSDLLPKRTARATQQRAHDLGIEMLKQARSEIAAIRAKQQNNLWRGTPPPELPDEYIKAVDIFQVGYRVASALGVVHEFAR